MRHLTPRPQLIPGTPVTFSWQREVPLEAASVSQGPLTTIPLLIVPLQGLGQGMYEVGPTGQRGWLRFGVFTNAGCNRASVVSLQS